MLGYILPEKPELRVREFELYNGYYCGLCKEIGENYGQIARLWLSNDMAFLAMFLGALTGGDDHLEYKHCIMHPIAKKPVEAYEQAIKYASDMMIILGYENFMDDVRDNEKASWEAKLLRLEKKYQKARKLHPEVADIIHTNLQQLYAQEVQGKSNVKEMSECFGKVMAAVFTGYNIPSEQLRTVYTFADNLGKWLYLLDIMDDFEDDMREFRFNPIVDLGIQSREKAVEMAEPALYHYLGEMAKAYDLLEFRKNKDILDNVIFLGLRRITDDVLKGKERDDDKRSICGIRPF